MATTCPRCGNPAVAGRKFCNKCGAPLPAVPVVAPTAPVARAPPPPPAPGPRAKSAGLSIWFLIIPTVAFAALKVILSDRRDFVSLGIAVAIAIALYLWKQRPLEQTASPTLRRLQPFAYALQIGVVFVMLGGVSAAVILGVVLLFVLWIAKNPEGMMGTLEPWWSFQEKLPGVLRKLLAFGIPGAIGYYIGSKWAGGMEWGMTLLSVSIGAMIAFLFLFTPPTSLRRRTGGA